MSSADAGSLERFVEAQGPVYTAALGEIRRGAKRSHWMWFIFPQLRGLGRSEAAQFFGIDGIDEAIAYLGHPILGARYVECVEALQDLAISDPEAVFGAVDAIKLHSSLTLFEEARSSALFSAALERWFAGVRDAATLGMLAAEDVGRRG